MTFAVNGEPVEAGGADDRLLPWERVQEIAGISRTTAWRMERVGDFPQRVAVSPNRVGWWESELTAWKNLRSQARLPTPRPLRPPRAPRLIETARSPRPCPPRELAAPSPKPLQTEAVQADLPLTPPKATRKRGRTRGGAHPDQIDFGF